MANEQKELILLLLSSGLIKNQASISALNQVLNGVKVSAANRYNTQPFPRNMPRWHHNSLMNRCYTRALSGLRCAEALRYAKRHITVEFQSVNQ